MDTELFDLCKEVYKRTGWETGQYVHPITGRVKIEGLDLFTGDEASLYTSDYLFTKLIDEGIEVTLQYVSHDTALSTFRYRIDLLGKYTAYTPYMKMGEYEGSDTPTVALLKLVIFSGITFDDGASA